MYNIQHSVKVCKNNGVSISMLRASQFTKDDIGKHDLVVALDESNVENLKKLGVSNVVKLGAYGYDSQDVPDPYFFDGFEGFDKVFEMIDTCVDELLKKEMNDD